jgi:cell division septation protein DedD
MNNVFAWIKKQFHALTTAVHGSMSTESSSCSKSGLHLEKKQLNRTLALLIISGIALFISGYFWGQHSATEQVLNAVERDSFADQIYYSMCSANEPRDEEEEDEGQEDQSEPAEEAEGEQKSATQEKAQPKKTYAAAIAGFGAQKTADRYAQKLKARGFPVHVAQRTSRSARGRTVSWYQVVTDPFTDRQEGERVVAQIRSQENIRSIALIEIS